MATTIRLNEDLLSRVKDAALECGQPVSLFIEETLRARLAAAARAFKETALAADTAVEQADDAFGVIAGLDGPG